jgi:hypothetical protein
MSVSFELNGVGYLLVILTTLTHLLGRSLRELNGVGYPSKISPTPTNLLSPLRAEGTGLSENVSRVQIPLAARDCGGSSAGRAIHQLLSGSLLAPNHEEGWR